MAEQRADESRLGPWQIDGNAGSVACDEQTKRRKKKKRKKKNGPTWDQVTVDCRGEMGKQSALSTYDNMLNTNCTNSTVTVQGVTIGSTKITAEAGSVINVESKGSLIRTKNSNVNITATEIQRLLKIRYRNLALPVVSWMKGKHLPLENYFIPLQLRSSRWSRDVTDRNYNLENIFDCDDNDQVSRILIESQAGYGKTSLVHKIMDDWVREKNYIRPFECAVMIILKHLKGRTIKDAILDEINLKIDNERVWEMIDNDKTLLLLDGLDEISEVDRQNVLQTLYDIIGYKMTIIVTCRVGLFKLEDDEMSNLFRGAAKSERFSDKTFAIMGFNGENTVRFLEKFVEVEIMDLILKMIPDFTNLTKELFASPLMLILLVYITRENPRYNIKTNTDLFKKLIDCIVKRSVNDKGVGDKLEQNFTLFGTKTNDNCQYHELLCKFGTNSMGHILKDNLQFECDEFTDSIYRIGFFTKHEKKSIFETLTHYECFHLTVLEFVAAFALWNEFKNNGNQFSIETVNKINGLHSKKGGTSMVIPFLCGLMETDVVKFFTQFADYCALYSTEKDLMELIVNECSLSEELYGAISKFIPPVYMCHDPQTLILINFNFYQNIVTLELTIRQLWVLARNRNINVKSLVVYFIDESQAEDTDHYFRNDVKCDNLYVYWYPKIEAYGIIAMQFKLILNCISAKYKNVIIQSVAIRNDAWLEILGKCIDSGMFNNHTIDFLHYELPTDYDVDATARETVEKVFKNINFKHHSMRCSSALNSHSLNNIISTIADSSAITSLFICHKGSMSNVLKLDLSKILKKEEKCWDYLSIENLNVECTVPAIKNDCIKSLDVSGNVSRSCVDVLFSLKLTKLMCNIDMFGSILRKPNLSSWVGFKSIVNLILIFNGQTADMKISPRWDEFRNLEYVRFYICGSVTEELQSEILTNLSLLKTSRLQLTCHNEIYLSRTFCNLVSGVQNLVERNRLKLVNAIDFEIVQRGLDNEQFASHFDTVVVESIISAVKCNSKITATFVFFRIAESFLELRQLFNYIDFSILNVWQMVGEIGSPHHLKKVPLNRYYPNERVLKLQRKNVA